jgi:hypothetical protein
MSYGEMKDSGGSCLLKKRPGQQEFCSRSFRSSVKKDGCQIEMSRRSDVHSRNSAVRLAAVSLHYRLLYDIMKDTNEGACLLVISRSNVRIKDLSPCLL